jgi:hypothetical protein
MDFPKSQRRVPHGFRSAGIQLRSPAGDRRSRATACWRTTAILTMALALLLVAAEAKAATYYVSTSGKDTDSGQQSSPWRTISKAAATMVAGDTAVIRGGIYAEKITQTKSGTATSPITFTAATGEIPIVDGTGVSVGTYGALWTFSAASYVKLDGLTFKNSPAHCVALASNTTHVDIGRLDVSNCHAAAAIWVEGCTVPSFSRIHDNKVHDNPQGGIVLWNAPGGYYLIERNQVWNNAGSANFDGIQVGGQDAALHHVVVRNNVAHDNGTATVGADQIDMGGHGSVHHYLLEANEVYGAGGAIKMHGNPAQYTIARFNRVNTNNGFDEYDQPNAPAIYNNTIVGTAHGILLYSDYVVSGYGSSYGGMEIRNNLFVDQRNYALNVAAVSGGKIDIRYSSLKLDGNMYKFGTKGISWYPRSFNCELADPTGANEFAAYQAANSPDLQDRRGKRTTVSASQILQNVGARNYQLTTNSPAIDAGVELTTTRANGDNVTRIPVVRSSFFQDGYGGLIAPDRVQVGSNRPVGIVSVDDANNTITVDTAISFRSGDPVNLPFNGVAPDVGAYESGSTGVSAPNLISVDPVS